MPFEKGHKLSVDRPNPGEGKDKSNKQRASEAISKNRDRIPDFLDELQSEGRYTFSLDEIARAVNGSDVALQSAIRRLKKKGRVTSPRRGFFVIVPTEYRSTGAPPASWLIDDLMSYLGQPYYVGLLSAAAVHGAAHQQPQVFQVVTNIPTAPMTAARLRIAKKSQIGNATARSTKAM